MLGFHGVNEVEMGKISKRAQMRVVLPCFEQRCFESKSTSQHGSKKAVFGFTLIFATITDIFTKNPMTSP